MTWFWVFFIVFLASFFIYKQHQDRQRPAKVLTLIPANGMAPPVSKEVTKSWWEGIKETFKKLAMVAICLLIGWALRGCSL